MTRSLLTGILESAGYAVLLAADVGEAQHHFEAHDPATLVRMQPQRARTFRIWLDVGDRDGWEPVVTAFHQELSELGIPHEFGVLAGIHEDDYWTEHLPTYLRFYSRTLR